MKYSFPFILILLVVVAFSSCESNSATNSNANVKKTPEVINTPKEAIESFLKTKYPGWIMKGDTLDKSVNTDLWDESNEFNVHLQKDKEDKVITLILKKFQNPEGNIYWLVYESTKLEIAQRQLKEAKIQAIDNFEEESASQEPPNNEPYDPR